MACIICIQTLLLAEECFSHKCADKEASSYCEQMLAQELTTLTTEQLFQIGLHYASNPSEQCQRNARYYYRLAADQGHSLAQSYLGVMIQEGVGGTQSDKEAIHFFQVSAAQGNSHALNNLGRVYQFGLGLERNDSIAVDYYKRSSNLGNLIAQCNLAYMYWNGLGVEPSRRTAYELSEGAANQGQPLGLYNMALMLIEDAEAEQDSAEQTVKYEKALKYLQEASHHGCTLATNRLVEAYEDGLMVAQNLTAAYDCFLIAATGRNSNAIYRLGTAHIYGNLTTENPDLALSYLYEAWSLGFSDASISIGYIYLTSGYFSDALAYFSSSDAICTAEAQYYLAYMHRRGSELPRDRTAEFLCLERAAAQNHPRALEDLQRSFSDFVTLPIKTSNQ